MAGRATPGLSNGTRLSERGVKQRVLTPRGSPLANRLAEIDGLVLEYTERLDVVLAGLLHTRPFDIIHAHRGSAHHQALEGA